MTHPTRWTIALMILLLALLVGCGDEITNFNSGGGGTPGDTDGDGLSDSEERDIYHTSPVLADTDGDGYSDYEEVVEFGFNPGHDNYKFNPVIADIARIHVAFVTAPDIRMEFEVGEDVSVERSFTSAQTKSEVQAETTSYSMEGSIESVLSWIPELTASITVGTGGESSHEWGVEQTQENSNAYGQTATTNFTGGILSLALSIENPGDIAYTVNNLILGGTAIFPGRGAKLRPVGNLNIASSGGGFDGFTIGPHSFAGPLVFETEMDVGLTRELLADSRGLAVSVAAREILDTDGVSYTQRETTILARTATIFIDYGPTGDLFIEKHLVATNIDPDVLHVTMQQVMETLLDIPHLVEPGLGLTSVRGVTGVTGDWDWVIAHDTVIDGFPRVDFYRALFPYDFNAIEVYSGDLVRIVFMSDADGDQLGLREERIQGTDPELADTDEDGLDDYFEIYTGWIDGFSGELVYSSPRVADTDGDGLNDAEERAAFTNPTRADTDGDHISDYVDAEPLVSSLAAPWILVSAGAEHSLGLKADGTLWAWGSNLAGQLGLGDRVDRDSPTQVGSDPNWVAISAGTLFSLALKSNGTLWSWGNERLGTLGHGADTTPPTLDTACIADVTAYFEEFDPGSGCILTPQPVGSDSDWIKIAAGPHHGLGIRGIGGMSTDTQGSLWAWGSNNRGELGLGDLIERNAPTNNGDASTDWAEIYAGGDPQGHGGSSQGIKSTGNVFSWGVNLVGQAGIGGATLLDPTNSGVGVYVALGRVSSLRLNSSGEFWLAGVLPPYTVTAGAIPKQIFQTETPLMAPGSFDLGQDYGVAIFEQGSPGQGAVYTWGVGEALGRAPANQFAEAVGSSAEWVFVSAGSDHVLAIKNNGSLYSWGNNIYGQTGRGDPAVVGIVLATPGLVD